MADKFELVNADFGKDVNGDMQAYVDEYLTQLIDRHRTLHTQLIPKWRKLYLGVPAEATRNFPFPNAANTVVQVIGETVDTMVARVMGLQFATHPTWPFKNYAKADNEEEIALNEKKRTVLEDFMDIVGMEPAELDLQRVEAMWFTDACKLGTAFVKKSIEHQVEGMVVGYSEQSTKKGFDGREIVTYSGPRITKLRHEDVMADPDAQTLEDCGLVAIKRTLKRWQLEERAHTGAYPKAKVDAILAQPDRTSTTPVITDELQQQGVSAPSRPEVSAEWDIYECWFPWWYRNRKYRIIMSYHRKSRTVMRQVFNFMPNNELGIELARLGYRTDGLYGHGYAELLETYQEELSTTHNQRLDNATVANIRALRVSPRARALDANLELYPSALLVAEKDDIEAIAVGDVYPSTFKNEEMTLGLVARRSGTTPAVAGAGTGSMMKRPAQYSAQGTLAVMQENNTTVGFATSEFRRAHVKLGASLASMYGKFGTNGREEAFGMDGDVLRMALREFEAQRLRIPIRAATGSLNREVDKQTGMLMEGLSQRHYTAVGQLLQALANPMIDQATRDYFIAVAKASVRLHSRVMKDFGYEQPATYVPEPKIQGSQPAAQGQVPPGGAPAGGAPVAGAGATAAGGRGPMVPLPGVGGSQVGPLPNAGEGGGGGAVR